MTWATARLSEVASIRHGGTPSKKERRFWNGDIPWVSPKDMRGSVLTDTEDHITAEAVASSATSVMPANSIFLVARSGILAHSVPVALASRPMAFNQDIKAITVDPARLDAEYALWYLRNQQGRILVQGVKRGATVHSLHSGFVENLSIHLPHLDEQRRIVEILNRANGIGRLRREALDKTRQLIPAVFVDVFGDPASNPKDWPITRLGEVLSGCDYGTSQKATTQPPGLPVLRMGNVTYQGDLQLDDLKYIALAKKDRKRHLLAEGDILFNRTNSKDLVGKSGLWDGRFEAVAASYFIRLRLDQGRATPTYVWTFLNSSFMKRRLFATARGAIGQSNINAKELKSFTIPLPPSTLQTEFASHVADIQATIGQQERMAEASEQLVASLMAQLFDGAPAKPDALAVLA